MDTFKKLLDEKDLSQINQDISQFIHSADGYANRLKLAVALINLINESCTLLRTIDVNGFINDIRRRIDDVESQSGNLKEAFCRHLDTNNEIGAILANPGNNEIPKLKAEIEELLKRYDGLLGDIVKLRETLPVETILKEQEQR